MPRSRVEIGESLEEKVSKEHVKKVLLEINDPLVRGYFKNMVKFRTGVDPANANELDLEASIDFLKHVWAMCLDWGHQRFEFIDQSIRQLDEFLKTFNSKDKIHNLQSFSKKLENYSAVKPRKSTTLHDPSNEALKLTRLLTGFKSVRIKTAALIMRFVCLDCGFFEVDKNKLIPPLDRVNYRMCKKLFGKENIEAKLGKPKPKGTFNEKATMAFNDLGKDVLGEDKILIDNLWFIGHFYHNEPFQDKRLNCQVIEGVKILELPYLQDIELQNSCPFSKYGCIKSREDTNAP